ncbi:MAG: hypothetical protein M0R17_03640 [Candidatus Omnitrophica bacterium]|nr:hypothetical protein [Candidatus Omnitrophota bacterium]
MEYEMSSDTYPYGLDASPIVRTANGHNPRIDSFSIRGIYGNIRGIRISWDTNGICTCHKPRYNLEFSDLFFNYPSANDILKVK